ncbi:hypothetical protein KY341_00535, partial [Candidatus Woesearchaeota archaeon]|nr:hypothetical protein [Candidatus Woesearchaeota archaeon]
LLAGNGECERKFRDQEMICCRVEGTDIEEARGYGANSHLIRVFFDNERTPLYPYERKDLEIGQQHKLRVDFEEADLKRILKVNEPKHCTVYMKDTINGDEFFPSDSVIEFKEASTDPNVLKNYPRECKKDFTIIASELQAGRTYEFRVIVFDYNETLKGENLKDLPSESHWLSEFAVLLRVKPILEITDISTLWVNADDINVRCYEPYKLSRVWGGIVSEDQIRNAKNLYEGLRTACENPSSGWHDSIHRITALKAGEEGINIIFTFGREAYQSMKYESQAQKIEFNEKSANIHLDASSISETFKITDMLVEYENADQLKENYLCVKAEVVGPDGSKKEVTAYSERPLRLDVAPPMIKNSDDYIEVKYPKPVKTMLKELEQQGRITPGQYVTPYHFEEYPKAVIKHCYDKSGCVRYDYYFAPTNINININVQDWESGAVATILGFGLNYLYNYLTTRNPLTTLCPLADSGQYRYNPNPEIRFRKDAQGVYCIKTVDAVGNYWLTWKTVYNPYSIIEKAIHLGVSEVEDLGPIVPVVGG